MAVDKASVLVFDSGMGGLTVAGAVMRHLPRTRMDYVADMAGFPYGAWDETQLADRICDVTGRLIEDVLPDVVVIACNTASTVALEQLRERFNLPFVGTVPAIKPAAGQTGSGVIGVLATEGTVSREYTRALIETYAFHCEVVLHGSAGLAALAEQKMRGEEVPIASVREECAPVFVERAGGRTDVVVLGCTHYPLLLDELRQAAPWPCTFIDPAEAIARRVEDVLPASIGPGHEARGATAYVTCARGLQNAPVFASFGFNDTKLIDLPVESGV